MHKSLVLLEQAIALAEGELALVETDEAEGLAQSAKQRAVLLTQAIEGRDGCDADAMLAAMQRLRDLQEKLSARASARFEEDRESLRLYRSTSKMLSGYNNARNIKRGPRVFTKFS